MWNDSSHPVGVEFDSDASWNEAFNSLHRVKVSLKVSYTLNTTIYIYKNDYSEEDVKETVRKQIQFPTTICWEETEFKIDNIGE